MVLHSIEPVFDKCSEILILGSFPSVLSRERGFFYAHPQNRFWKVLASLFDEKVPTSSDEKKDFLLKHRIALWDVIASCDIVGSSDNSIENAVANDLSEILCVANIREIFVNGRKADELFKKHIRECIGREATYLPSTSPANASWTLEKLIEAWSVVREKNNE